MIRFGHKILFGFGSHEQPPGKIDMSDNSILLWMNFGDRWFRVENQSMMEAMRKLEVPQTEDEFLETVKNMRI